MQGQHNVIQESLYTTALEVSTTDEAAFKTVNEPTTEEEQLLDIVDEQTSPEVELKLQTEALSDEARGDTNDLTPEDVVIVPKVTDNVDEPTKNEPVSSTLPPTDVQEVEDGNDDNEKSEPVSDNDEKIQQVAQEIVEAAINKEVDQKKVV